MPPHCSNKVPRGIPPEQIAKGIHKEILAEAEGVSYLVAKGRKDSQREIKKLPFEISTDNRAKLGQGKPWTMQQARLVPIMQQRTLPRIFAVSETHVNTSKRRRECLGLTRSPNKELAQLRCSCCLFHLTQWLPYELDGCYVVQVEVGM